ncbi:hypothetical protein ELBR111191_00510 [Elizabethkingia bruuniana]
MLAKARIASQYLILYSLGKDLNLAKADNYLNA